MKRICLAPYETLTVASIAGIYRPARLVNVLSNLFDCATVNCLGGIIGAAFVNGQIEAVDFVNRKPNRIVKLIKSDFAPNCDFLGHRIFSNVKEYRSEFARPDDYTT
jgi:hypothetical protein